MGEDVPERFRSILADILAVPARQITADLGAGEIPAWDSLRHLQMVLAIELEYGVEFDPTQIPALSTVRLLQQELESMGVTVD
jgi:acyl carrier protein